MIVNQRKTLLRLAASQGKPEQVRYGLFLLLPIKPEYIEWPTGEKEVERVTEAQRIRLGELAVMRPQSFPNGSSYDMESLPEGNFGDVEITAVYNCGYHCRFSDGELVVVSYDRVGEGAGVDLGEHFCSQDQMLADLLPA